MIGVYHSSSAFGDYDNDGDLDIIITGLDAADTPVSKLYKNNGSGIFTTDTGTSLPGVARGSAVFGDYDNDGDLDILLTGEDSTGTSISRLFQNGVTEANAAPAPPTTLSSDYVNNKLSLSWNEAVDDNTPSGSLTYNIRVGTTPGGNDVHSGATPAVFGQIGVVNFYGQNLTVGTFYWSVQAVDNGLAKSAWANDQRINGPPIISAITQLPDTSSTTGPYVVTARIIDDTGVSSAILKYDSGSGYTDVPMFDDGLHNDGAVGDSVYGGDIPGQDYGIVKYYVSALDVEGLDAVNPAGAPANYFSFQVSVFTKDNGSSIVGFSEGSTAFGDYDNDGDLDLVVTGSGTSRLYKNDGSGIYTEDTGSSLPEIYQTSVAFGDYDNDGDLDILIAGKLATTIPLTKLYKNNGSGIFTEDTGSYLSGVYKGSVVFGDYDNDGDLDILISGQDSLAYLVSKTSKLYQNDGSGIFTQDTRSSLRGVWNSSTAFADYDNDGDLDILIAGMDTANVSISTLYNNDGSGVFTEDTGSSLEGVDVGSTAFGDYDNDGDLDLLITGGSAQSLRSSKLYKNNGSGIFTEDIGSSLEQVFKGSTTFGDYDNDGDLDILITGFASFSYISKLYKNDGSGIFTEDITSSLAGVYKSCAAFGDYDNDGDLDILIIGDRGGLYAKLYQNGGTETNALPTPPTTLNSDFVNNKLVLSWNEAADDNTPSGCLTYNIRVGTTSGGNDVYSGVTPAVFGRIGLVNFDSLNVANGIYYWSVQAVDYGLAKSVWSSEQLHYNSEPPIISDVIQQPDTYSITGPYVVTARIIYDGGESSTILKYDSGSGYTDVPMFDDGLHNDGAAGDSVYGGSIPGQDFGIVKYYVFALDAAGRAVVNPADAPANYYSFRIWRFIEDTGSSLDEVKYSSVAFGDYDNDGDLDIFITGMKSSGARISKFYKNDGSGTFTEDTGSFLEGVRYGSVAFGDYDNDGDLDILITGNNSSSIRISKLYKNDGSGFFTEDTGSSLEGVYRSSVAFSDYDNDGDLDILITGNKSGGRISKLYKNNGSGIFTEDTNSSLAGVEYSSTAFGDYDNDGDLDILIAGLNSSGARISKLYKNNGSGIFTEDTNSSLAGVEYGSVAFGDYNNDGDLDILITGAGASAGGDRNSKLYKNDGSGIFTEDTGSPLTGVYYSATAFGDYDNDGDLDILITGRDANYNKFSILYKNRETETNALPTPPTTLNSNFIDNKVVFSWNEAVDDNTPSGSLTYNLRVGTTSVSNNVYFGVTPAVFGRLGLVNFDSLNLAAGNYYWSVQAVDNGLAKSAWSAEQSHRVNAPPIISDVTQLPDTYSTTGPYTVTTRIVDDVGVNSANLKYDTGSGYTDVPMFDDGLHNDSAAGDSVYGGDIPGPACGIVKYYVYALDTEGLDMVNPADAPANHYSFRIWRFTEDTGSALDGVISGVNTFGDYDNDGDIDILITGNSAAGNPVSKLYKNDGSGIFTEDTGSSLEPVNYSSNAFGDYDNDGDLDIIIAGKDINNTGVSKLYKNDGSGIFTEDTSSSLEGVYHSSVDFGDYDNDGTLDIIITGKDINNVGVTKLYYNEGNSIFTECTCFTLEQVFNGSTIFADYDNDGDLDLLIMGSLISKLYKNDGNGIFAEDRSSSLTGVWNSFAAFGDYDNDGDLDILIAGRDAADIHISKLYKNDGSGVFTEDTGSVLEGYDNGSFVFGDYDNDGDLDILISGEEVAGIPESKLYNNDGSGVFTEDTGPSLEGFYFSSVAFGDYDNDGDLDIFISGRDAANTEITKLFNNAETEPNAAPTPPTTLNSDFVNNKLVLSWNEAVDDNTPSGCLTYNLRVGSTSGGNDVYSGATPAVSGRLGLVNFDSLNIADGIYYWSVQAVDNGLAKSVWTAEILAGANNPPIITSAAVEFAVVDSLYEYTVSADDPDRDNLTYTLDEKPTGMTIETATGFISWTPGENDIGDNLISLRASDLDTFTVQSYTLIVYSNPVEIIIETVTSDTGEVFFPFTDQSMIGIDFLSGGVTGGVITLMCYGNTPPPVLADLTAVQSFLYFQIESDFSSSFSATLTFTYTDDQFTATGVSNEEDMQFAFFNGTTWETVFTTVDSANNIVTANITHFSEWVLGDSISFITDVETMTEDIVIETYNLYQNYPNPFNPTTTIRYALPKSGTVSISIFDLLGREVIRLVDEEKPAGLYKVIWDGKNSQGIEAANGVYIYRMSAIETAGKQKILKTKKLLLIK